jgi:hypothetical protein
MSCGGLFSAVQLIAGAGMLQNVGLSVPSSLTSAVSGLNSIPAIGEINNVLGAASSVLSPAVTAQLGSLASTSFPALSNAIPADLSSKLSSLAPGGSSLGLSNLVSGAANGIMGNGDLSQFAQNFSAATGYAGQVNNFIGSAQNLGGISNTFSSVTGGMQNLVTGGFNVVTDNFPALSEDLSQLGSAVNLSDLPSLGEPAALLRSVTDKTGGVLPGITQALGDAGVDPAVVTNVAQGLGGASATAQRSMYQAFTQVQGSELDQVKRVLGVTTPGINNMAELLDPKKILPNSVSSLRMPTPDGIQAIYGASGSVNTNLAGFLQDPNAPEYTGDDPIIRARLGLPPTQT